MKTPLFTLLFLAILISSCKKEESTPAAINLISNYSFETPGHDSTFVGWTSTCFLPGPVDNPMAPLVMDAPVGGGSWSMQLWPSWFPGDGSGETIITGQSGNNVYHVGSWVKCYQWYGTVSLQQWRNGQKISEKWVTDTTSSWTYVSFTDTLNTLPTPHPLLHP